MGLTDVGGCEEDQQDAFTLYPFTTIAIFFYFKEKKLGMWKYSSWFLSSWTYLLAQYILEFLS